MKLLKPPSVQTEGYRRNIETNLGFSQTWIDKNGHMNFVASIPSSDTFVIASQERKEESIGTILGKPILFNRSEMPFEDATFFRGLIEARLHGGGAIITIDHRDNYRKDREPYFDEGAHYALISTTHTYGKQVLFRRNAYCNIPLPIFTRLLGHGWVQETDVAPEIDDYDRWGITETVEFLNRLLPGNVCIGDGTFHRIDANIGNAGTVVGTSSYRWNHGLFWEDTLCQAGISPEDTEVFINAYNNPDEILVVRSSEILLVDIRTEEEKVITTGNLVGKLDPKGHSNWYEGLSNPKAPAYNLYNNTWLIK